MNDREKVEQFEELGEKIIYAFLPLVHDKDSAIAYSALANCLVSFGKMRGLTKEAQVDAFIIMLKEHYE